MAKSFADVEQDMRFQLDLVRLADALRAPVESRSDAAQAQAGMMEELVRVQKRKRPGNRING